MKSYVLNLGGYEPPEMSARELRTLFHQGAVERTTVCRHRRSLVWSTVDDIFPMLKYEPRRFCVSLARSPGPIRRSAAKLTAAASFGDLVRFLGRPSSPL
ncbi:MAG TPA: hypothetical protein VK474_13710 [Chthoniobacterales bacterium]|nr:hypothetical protein [Chthoniobacterales bacterium]